MLSGVCPHVPAHYNVQNLRGDMHAYDVHAANNHLVIFSLRNIHAF